MFSFFCLFKYNKSIEYKKEAKFINKGGQLIFVGKISFVEMHSKPDFVSTRAPSSFPTVSVYKPVRRPKSCCLAKFWYIIAFWGNLQISSVDVDEGKRRFMRYK